MRLLKVLSKPRSFTTRGEPSVVDRNPCPVIESEDRPIAPPLHPDYTIEVDISDPPPGQRVGRRSAIRTGSQLRAEQWGRRFASTERFGPVFIAVPSRTAGHVGDVATPERAHHDQSPDRAGGAGTSESSRDARSARLGEIG